MNFRQAIVTKFHGPTNKIGARVSAKADAGRIMVSWDHSLDVDSNHYRAALALATKLQWGDKLAGGGLPGSGYCFVVL